QQALSFSGCGANRVVGLVALGIDKLTAELKRVMSFRLQQVISQGVSGIGVSPRHVAGIDSKTAPAVHGVSAENFRCGHLPAETIIEDMADRTLRNTGDRICAQRRIALSWRCRVRN